MGLGVTFASTPKLNAKQCALMRLPSPFEFVVVPNTQYCSVVRRQEFDWVLLIRCPILIGQDTCFQVNPPAGRDGRVSVFVLNVFAQEPPSTQHPELQQHISHASLVCAPQLLRKRSSRRNS